MPGAWYLALQSDSFAAVVDLPRTAGDPTLTLAHGPAVDLPWPLDVAILRGTEVVTVLIATGVTAPDPATLAISGPAGDYADADQVVGDVAAIVPPDPATIAAALKITPTWLYGPI